MISTDEYGVLIEFIEDYLSTYYENNYKSFIRFLEMHPLNNELYNVKYLAREKEIAFGEDYFNVALSSHCPDEIANFIIRDM